MSDPFSKFGIDHLSASSLNLYVKQPAKWALCYLHGFREEGSPAAWRGSAVEAGLDHWLFERDLDAAFKVAALRFEDDAKGLVDDATDKERKSILPMLEQAAIKLANWEKPDARQLKFEYRFPGIEIPIIGYIDYLWPHKGLDLKTTHRMPSELSEEHAAQSSLYSIVKARPFDVLYVTKTKSQVIPVEDASRYVKRLERCAHSIRSLLCVYPDKHDATRALPPPDFDHPYLWKSEAAREAITQIWN